MELLQQIRKMPFLRILIPYLAGLIGGYYYFSSEAIRILLIAFAPIVVFLFVLNAGNPIQYRYSWIFGALMWLMLCMFGMVNILSREYVKNRFKIRDSELIMSSLIIMDTPEINAGSVKSVAQIHYLYNYHNSKWLKTKVMLTLPRNLRSEAIKPGDIILLQARFLPVPGPVNPGEFDYGSFLSRQDIDYQIFAGNNKWKLAGHDHKNLKILAVRCRDHLLNSYRTSQIEPRLVAVLSALTLGYKTDMEAETTDLFTKAGVVHVMALSGFNVGIIFLMINYCLGFLRKQKTSGIIRLLVSLLAVWIFAVITGLSSSVTRASVMISLFLVAKHINRDVHPLNVVSASAFLMLVLSPFCFLDVGFQLSYAAVLGIVYIQPYLYRLYTAKRFLPDKIWMLFTVSVAAQLATAPLTLYYFHQFPLFFWITNLYVVPLVTLIIYVSIPFILFSFLEPVKTFLSWILEYLIKAILWPLDRLGDFPGAVADGIFISKIQVILLFTILVLTGLFIMHRKAAYALIALTMLLTFVITDIFRLFSTNRQHYLTVNCIHGASIMNIISGKKNLVMAFSEKPIDRKMLQYSFYNWWIERHVLRTIEIRAGNQLIPAAGSISPEVSMQNAVLGDNVFLNYSGTTLIVCTDDVFEHYSSQHRLKMNYVVVTKNIKPDIKKLLNHFEIGGIIIDSSVGYYKSREWLALCRSNNIDCWPVRDKGAFVLEVR
jgi:competence protein ComEC